MDDAIVFRLLPGFSVSGSWVVISRSVVSGEMSDTPVGEGELMRGILSGWITSVGVFSGWITSVGIFVVGVFSVGLLVL